MNNSTDIKPSIYLENVSKNFGKKQVLENINLQIPPSKIFGLLGPSGSGKTTMVKMISGIDNSSSGNVYLLNEKMPKLSLMNKIGYMAQSDALYLELTAEENLKFFAQIYGVKGVTQKRRIIEVMDLVELSDDLKRPVHQFSGGMKRRLSLAISLLHEPKILILDEPTVGIDPVLRKSIWDKFSILSKNGTTILITTHVMDEADKCDYLAMLRNGHIIAVGSPESLKKETATNNIEEAFLYYGGVKNEN